MDTRQRRRPMGSSEPKLLEIIRNSDPEHPLSGVVVESGNQLLIVNVFNDDAMAFTGFAAFLATDIRSKRKRLDFADTALQLLKVKPARRTGLNGKTLEDLLEAAKRRGAIVGLYTEREDPDAAWFGRIDDVVDNRVTLRQVNTRGRWSTARTFTFSDITRVDFGGRYEHALALVAEDTNRACPGTC